MPIKVTRPEPTGVPGIIQDGPERFIVRARWTDNKGRRRKREAVAATLAEAVALKEKLIGAELPTERPTRQRFAAYAEQWIEVHGSHLQRSTRDRYVVALAHATVGLGQYYVDSLRPADIRIWHRTAAKQFAHTSVNGWLRVLRCALDEAVEDGVLAANPARAVRALPEGRTKGRRGNALGLEEFRRFLQAIDELKGGAISEDVARALEFIAWTGTRKSECLAAKWCDLIEDEFHVVHSVYRREEKPTKTDDPRKITIVEPLAEVLKEQRLWLLETQHPGLASGLVFPASPRHAKAGATRRGTDTVSWYRSPTCFDMPLRHIVMVANITPISVHSLRRTWENLARRAGIDQLVRRSMGGWRTEKAQAIYAMSDRAERKEAGSALVQLVVGED